MRKEKYQKRSADMKWSRYREDLISDVSKLATKEQLNFFLLVAPFTKPGAYRMWQEALMELRRRKQNKLK